VLTLKRDGNVYSLEYVNYDILFRYLMRGLGASFMNAEATATVSLSLCLPLPPSPHVNGSHAMFSLFQLLPALKPRHMYIQNSLTKYSSNPIEHYAPCTWNLYLLQHFYVCALLEFLRIFFLRTTVCCPSVRPSHKLHSILANYHMNSMQSIPVPPAPLYRDTQGCLCFYGTSQSH